MGIQCRQSIVVSDGSDVEVFGSKHSEGSRYMMRMSESMLLFSSGAIKSIPAANFHMKEIGLNIDIQLTTQKTLLW